MEVCTELPSKIPQKVPQTNTKNRRIEKSKNGYSFKAWFFGKIINPPHLRKQ